MSRLFIGAESLRPGNGGICRVARLVCKCIALDSALGSQSTSGVVLSDDSAPTDLGLRIGAANNSRTRFVGSVWRAAPFHSHFFYDFLGMARAHRGLPALLRRPFAAFIHGIEVWKGTTRPDRIAAALRADLLLSNSAVTRERAAEVDPTFRRAQVCWLGTEADDLPTPTPYGDRPADVLILGRLDPEPWKGHHALIEAWPTILQAVPEARLLVVGGGPGLAAAKELAAQSTAKAAIVFKGFVPDSEVEELWPRIAVLAMPGQMEGFGLAYVEAMRQGVPAIASVLDASSEINVDGVTGYNIDRTKPGVLADTLVHLLRDRQHAERLGKNGQERWFQHFRFSAFRERFTNRLKSWLG